MVLLAKCIRCCIREEEGSREKSSIYMILAPTLALYATPTRHTPVDHRYTYLSKQFNPAKINYDIYDKEMLAIVRSFHAWETLLKSYQKQIIV